MKINYFQLLLIMISSSAFGQTLSSVKQTTSHTTEICSQHTRTQQMQIDDPERFATIGKRNNAPLQEHYTPAIQEKVTGVVYTIPIVFHILHNGGSENISDAQIQDQLDILNRDFRRLNADANSVVTAFQGMPSDVEVEFKFATVAPDGTCFDGITRTQTSLTNSSNGQNQVNAVISGNNIYNGVWAHNKYLNVYIANDIGGAAGYTFLPNGNSSATAQNMYYNGIFLLHDYCGSIGTSAAFSSRALTHEIGHWLNLEHIWGGGNPGSTCGDDGIQDTPYTRGSTSCTLTANTCTNDNAYWGFNQIDNVENYMDYSYCSKMFTQGQVDEMRAALVSSVGGRSNIWTNTNLQNVGAIPGTSLCSIDFEANETVICAGTTVTYTPNTTTGISQYSWSFPGGNPTSSNLQNPTVTYNTPGNYNAILTVTSSGNGLDYVETKTTYITVNNNTTVSLPISEGFTNAGTPAGWTIVNPNGTGTTWARTTAAGLAPTAGNSFMFDNYNYNDPTDDEFHISKFSTVGMSSAQLTFDVAYAPYDATNYDGLEVLVSTDCGSTFTSVYLKTNTTLATRTATTGTFTPSSAQWRGETIDLTPYVGESSVLVSFKNLAGYGNRLFVDNINITGVTSAPTADFNASSATACVNQTVTYTDASVGATSWTWDFGAGATPPNATGAGPHDVTYSTGGPKTITLSINGGSTATESVTVSTITTPSFTQVAPICSGGSFSLPTTSNNGVSGTWSPAVNNTTTTMYTFTPSAGQCASSTTMTVTVDPSTTPAFTQVAPICSGGSFSLPTTSNNGISGTWSPAVNNTTTTMYTFTPTAGQCASTTTMTVTVNPVTTPSFTQVAPICSGGSFSLPTTSNNGVSGTWSPAIDNSTTTVYTFTPTAGQCASSTTMTVTVNPVTTPSFTQVAPICSGGSFTLPTTSNNGISGTWSPAINNTTTTTYTFTPTAGQCATTTTMSVTVNTSAATTPTFTQVAAICSGSGISTLPTTSNNGISGTWSPAINNTATTTYTFMPSAGQCASSTTMTITVNPLPTVTFGALSTMCVYNSPITLTQGSPSGGTYSGVGVSGGQFNPATAGNGTHTLTYTYTDGNNCTNSQNSNITVDGCLGIDEQDASFISIYPNPSNGIFTLKSGNYNLTSVTIYNHLGQIVLDQKSNLNEQEIDLTNFSNGIYTVRVNHEAGIENIRVILNK